MTTKLSIYLDRFPQDSEETAVMPLQENGVGDLAASKPTVIKIQNNTNYARWIRRNYPAIVVFCRDTGLEKSYEGQVPIEAIMQGLVTPDQAANIWYRTFRAAIESAGPGVVWNVAYNEPNKLTIGALNQFYLSIMKLGIPVAIGAFSNEFNLYDVEDQFKGALDRCAQLGYYLELHGYDNFLPPPGSDQPKTWAQLVNSPWLFPHKLLQFKGKIVYGERGIDNVKSENRFCPGWKAAHITAREYADFLIAVAKEDMKDPRVVGSTVFISTRNTNDYDKIDYATSFREPGEGKDPPEPCVDDYVLEYNYAHLADTIPGGTTSPPTDPPTGTILKAGWNVRWRPVVSPETKIGTNAVARPVEIIAREGDWVKIAVYVSKDAIQ